MVAYALFVPLLVVPQLQRHEATFVSFVGSLPKQIWSHSVGQATNETNLASCLAARLAKLAALVR